MSIVSSIRPVFIEASKPSDNEDDNQASWNSNDNPSDFTTREPGSWMIDVDIGLINADK